MAIERRHYDPATMYGAQENMTVDLGDVLDSNENEILEFDAVASAVNYVRLANAATGSGPTISAQGDDTNADLNIQSKGTGAVVVTGEIQLASDESLLDSNGNEYFSFSATASAVNELTISNAATGNGPTIQATGDDTNVNIELQPKGTGTVNVDAADNLTVNSIIVPQEIEVSYGPILNADIADNAFFIATQAYEVTKVSYIHKTAESAGTVNIQVERLQSTEAPGGNGDALLTNNSNAGFDGTATADTVQTGTLTGTTANLQLSAGDRLGVDFTGDAPGELDGVVITVSLKRI